MWIAPADVDEARLWWKADFYDLVSSNMEVARIADKFCDDIRGAPQHLPSDLERSSLANRIRLANATRCGGRSITECRRFDPGYMRLALRADREIRPTLGILEASSNLGSSSKSLART